LRIELEHVRDVPNDFGIPGGFLKRIDVNAVVKNRCEKPLDTVRLISPSNDLTPKTVSTVFQA
jgi:hypothetical protein